MDSALRPAGKLARFETTRILPGAFVGTLAALIAGFCVFSYSSTALLGFPDRPIGLGPLNGVDPSLRFGIYVRLVAASVGAWLACHHAARWLRQRLPRWFIGARSRLENGLINSFCAVASLALAAGVIGGSLQKLSSFYFCLDALAVLVLLALARRLLPSHFRVRRQLSAFGTIGALTLLAWPSWHIVSVIAQIDTGTRLGARLGALVLPLVFGTGLAWWLRKTPAPQRARVRAAWVMAMVPFFAFPALCPVANELQYTLARRHAVEPRQLALDALALLTPASLGLFWLRLSGRLRGSPQRWLSRVALPLIVFGSALITHHQQLLAREPVDALHDGEQITAIYEFLAHGKWPFVDVWPAHGLYDYLGLLYAKANGFLALELSAWNPFFFALTLTGAYAILASLYRPLFALAVATLLPVQALFPLPQHSFFYADPMLLGMALLVCWVQRRRPGWTVALGLAAAFGCFLTPTNGVAGVIAALALLLYACVSERRVESWLRLALFVGTGVAVGLLYVGVLSLSRHPVLDTLQLARAFVRADPMVGGRENVLSNFQTLAIWQYLLLPGIGALYLVALGRAALDRRPLTRSEQILAFLTVTSFVLFARTLTRHTLLERYQAFFFPLLGLALPLLRRAASSGSALFEREALCRGWFCAGLGLYFVAFPFDWPELLRAVPFQFRTWQKDEHRSALQLPSYPALRRFLDQNLSSDQSFLELLNMPLLYATFERELPGQFFLPTMFYATDTVQRSYLARFAAFGGPARVPVVLVPGPQGLGDLDNIATTLRSYRISERIHRDYVPYGRIDDFDVWVSRAAWDAAAPPLPSRALSWSDLGAARAKSLVAEREGDALVLQSTGNDPQLSDVLQLDGASSGGLGAVQSVEFDYRSDVKGKVTVSLAYGGHDFSARDSGSMKVRPSGEWQAATLALAPHADREPLTNLKIEPPRGSRFEIQNVKLVRGEPPAGAPESFSAGMLPFFWGNFDAQLAAHGGQVAQTLTVTGSDKPRTVFDLALKPGYDKSSGNYLRLCLRFALPEAAERARRWKQVVRDGSWQSPGSVTVRYGHPASSFSFALVQPNNVLPGLPPALARSFESECKPYVLRLSMAYVWQRQDVSQLHIEASMPVTIESAELLLGD
jgi:hypothetical protein